MTEHAPKPIPRGTYIFQFIGLCGPNACCEIVEGDFKGRTLYIPLFKFRNLKFAGTVAEETIG